MVFDEVGADGLEGAVADVQRDGDALDAARLERRSSDGVKCRPAVGAATDPAAFAKIVW